MEKSTGSGYTLNPSAQTQTDTSAAPKRRFGLMSALVRIVIAIAVLVAAGWQAMQMMADRPAPPQRQNMERTFTVTTVPATFDTHSSTIRTFGQVNAARTIDLRSQVQGRIVTVSPQFEVGNLVEAGTVIATVDSFTYDGALLEARGALANAELALSEAEQAHALELRNIEAAREALGAAETDLERARSLLASGSVTQQTVDTRVLTVSERAQTLNQRETNLFTLSATILRQRAAIEQANYQIETAQRNLDNTEIAAPFTGVVTARAVTEGGVISANEVVGALYAVDALEVNFTISDRQYGQLLAAGLPERDLSVTWELDPAPVTVAGTVSRTAPQIEAGTGGVTLIARLEPEGAQHLRPGTFVSVAIEGPGHEDSLRMPENALYNDDHFYVVREGRMARVPAIILARDNDHVIVSANLEPGEPVISGRLSQAGEGVAVRIEGADMPDAGGGPGGGGAMMRGLGGGS